MRTLYVGFSPLGQFTSGREREAEYMEFLEAYLKALQPHLEQKGWLDDAVFYMVDEAWGKDAVDANVKIAALMDRVAPRIKRLMTAPRDPSLMGRAQIWVPGGMPDAHPKDADAQARIAGWRAHNAEMWWYICCGPTHPYPNFFVDYPTIDNRMVFWLTWKYNKTGFLYWGVEYHGDPKDMTPDGPTERYELGPANMGNGDGTLCYWGPDMTLYPSVRLDAIRDGIEDYEYFAMLKRLADKAEAAHKAPDLVLQARKLLGVDDRVLRITDGSPNFAYPTDSANLLSARRQLAELIGRLSKQVKDDGPGR
jgi:hypothetical protein